jgi:hypothetical protein
VQTPTDDLGILGGAADAYRFSFAEIAVTQGMEQVISRSIEAWQRTVSGQEIQFADHLGLPDEKVQSLLDCYFDRYIDHGGAQMDRFIWERSCDLAFIAYALRAFPMNVPFFCSRGLIVRKGRNVRRKKSLRLCGNGYSTRSTYRYPDTVGNFRTMKPDKLQIASAVGTWTST